MANTLTKAPVHYMNFEKRYYVSASTADEYHENGSDIYDNRARWDDKSALSGSDLIYGNRDLSALYIVPIACKLKGFKGISTTFTTSGAHTVNLWYGDPSLETSSSTTLTLACTTSSSHNTRFQFEEMSAECNISLSAGDALIFTVNRDALATQIYVGSLTCLMELI